MNRKGQHRSNQTRRLYTCWLATPELLAFPLQLGATMPTPACGKWAQTHTGVRHTGVQVSLLLLIVKALSKTPHLSRGHHCDSLFNNVVQATQSSLLSPVWNLRPWLPVCLAAGGIASQSALQQVANEPETESLNDALVIEKVLLKKGA